MHVVHKQHAGEHRHYKEVFLVSLSLFGSPVRAYVSVRVSQCVSVWESLLSSHPLGRNWASDLAPIGFLPAEPAETVLSLECHFRNGVTCI